MFDNYIKRIKDEKKRRLEEKKREFDRKKIGERYVVNYGMLNPTYVLSNFDSRHSFLKYGSPGIYHRHSSLFTYISSYKTVLEYQGEGIFKDLISGEFICNEPSYDVCKAMNYPMCIDFSLNYLSPYFENVLDYSEEDINRIKFYFNLAKEKELSILCDMFQDSNMKDYLQEDLDSVKPTISSDYSSGPNDRLYYYYKDKNKMELNVDLSELERKSIEIEKSRIGKKYAIAYSDIYLVDKIEPGDWFDNVYVEKPYYVSNLDDVMGDKEKANLDLDYFTIVEYLGDGIYKDLTTGVCFSSALQNHYLYAPNWYKSIEYSDYYWWRFRYELFNYNKEFPLLIDEYNLRFISDKIVDKIGKNTLFNKDTIMSYIDECIKFSKDKWDEDLLDYYLSVYDEALEEYKLKSYSKEDNISDVKKLYHL